MLASGNDHLVAVKANLCLYRQVQAIVAYQPPLAPPFITKTTSEVVKRGDSYASLPLMVLNHSNGGVNTVLVVEHQSVRYGKFCSSQAYYISFLRTSAKQWMQMIRAHWEIENCLH